MEMITITGVASFDYFFSLFIYFTFSLMLIFGALYLMTKD